MHAPSRFPLHALALEAAWALRQAPGVLAIAITGSVARGNASATSDLDVWVLCGVNARRHGTLAGRPVTLLMQTVDTANQFDNLCLYEVPDAWVLHDPHGHFARLKATALASRPRIRRTVTQRSVSLLLDDLAEALSRPALPLTRLTAARKAAWQAATLETWVHHGWRVPKFQAVRTFLTPAQDQWLVTVLGLPLPHPEAHAATMEWRRYLRRLPRVLALAPWELPHLFRRQPPAPGFIQPELALTARRGLEQALPPLVVRVLEAGGSAESTHMNGVPPGTTRLWNHLHGTSAGVTKAQALTAVHALVSLLRSLNSSRLLASSHQRAAWAALPWPTRV